jgi:WD40 repeat protein
MRLKSQSWFVLGVALSLSLSSLAPLGSSVSAQLPSVPAPSAQTPAPAQNTPAQSTQSQNAPFKDVPADYWARDYIAGLAQANIIRGFPDGTFKPNEPVTRAQFAAILRKAFLPAPSSQSPVIPSATAFTDVPGNYWAAGDIAMARSAGFLSGYPGNQFRPNQPIPRVQALVAIANGLGYEGGTVRGLSAYKDASAIPAYARPGIAAARAANVIVNYPATDQLLPNRAATRAEVAAFVYQALVREGRAQPAPAAGIRWNKEPMTTLQATSGVGFSADGQRLLASASDGLKLQVWDTRTGALIREIANGDGRRFAAMAISKDGTKVATMTEISSDVSQTGFRNAFELTAWAVETGQPLWRKTISNEGSRTDGAQMSNDNAQIAFSLNDQQITTVENLSVTYEGGDIIRLAGSKLNLWKTATGEAVQSVRLNKDEDINFSEFSISPNSQFLAIGHNASPQVDIWKRNQSGLFEYFRTLPAEDSSVGSTIMVFRQDGYFNMATMGNSDGTLVTWDPEMGTRINSVVFSADNPHGFMRLSPDGENYFFGDPVADRTLLGNAKTGEVLDWQPGFPVFSDRGDLLAVTHYVPNADGAEGFTSFVSIYAKTVP